MKKITTIFAVWLVSYQFCGPAEVSNCPCPPVELCSGVDPATPLISFPSITQGLGIPRKVMLYGATDLTRVKFRIDDPVPYFTLRPEPDSPYVFEATRGENYLECQILSLGESFGVTRIQIEAFYEPPEGKWWKAEKSVLNSLEPCGEKAYFAIQPSHVEIFDDEGNIVPLQIRPGGLFLYPSDTFVSLLRGRVYFSDGHTPFEGARVFLCAIDGARLDGVSVSLEDGSYDLNNAQMPVTFVMTPESAGYSTACFSVEVRVCTKDCEVCLDSEELYLDQGKWGIPMVLEHDFILPIDPPSPTATPVDTETPTPTPSATPNPADINGDGKVDHEDVYLLKQHWLEGTE